MLGPAAPVGGPFDPPCFRGFVVGSAAVSLHSARAGEILKPAAKVDIRWLPPPATCVFSLSPTPSPRGLLVRPHA
jgi:hypothetical protein